MATLEMINTMLNSKHSLFKRNGQPNEANIAIMKRLHDITPAEIERFKKEDEGWNWTPQEKHDRGYHSLRALDRWYKKNGHGCGSDGTDPEDSGRGSGRGSREGMPGNGNGESSGNSDADSDNGNGNNGSSDGNGSERDGNGDNGNDSNGNGENNGNGSDSNGSDGNGESDGNSDGNGEGNEGSDGNGNDSNGDGNGDSNGEGSDGSENAESDEPNPNPNEEEPKPNEEPDNKPNPNEKLTDLEEELDFIITVPQADGKPNNLYIHGPAGCGKSFGVQGLAVKKGYGYWETGIVSMKEELLGFRTANGAYADTEFIKILKDGIPGKDITIILFDEFDGNSNSVTLPLNNLIASRRFTIPSGVFKVHPSVRFVATGNTTMDGSTEDYERESADRSVKTRWLMLPADYDKNIEKKLADKDTVKFLQELRKAKDHIGLNLMVTYREFTALNWGEKAVESGKFTRSKVLELCVLKGLTDDDKDNLRRDDAIKKLIAKGNRWAVEL